jgi:hypothetical protein
MLPLFTPVVLEYHTSSTIVHSLDYFQQANVAVASLALLAVPAEAMTSPALDSSVALMHLKYHRMIQVA